MARRTDEFQTIRSEGGLLPPDLLRRVLDPKANLAGTRPEDYGLPQGERLNEVITQSWNRLRKHWAEFRAVAGSLPQSEAGTGLTNDKWSLPLLRELGFGLLPTSAGPEVDGRTYAISRFFGPVPVHLVGCGLSLDRRAAGQRGAAAANPHGLVQEFVNRSPGHLWAIVSNGMRLRVLRDSQALSRQSFLEFDLEAMFHGEVYSDFVLLWLMVHATRFAPRENERPETCWLEQWTKEAEEQGTRALEGLRGGVEKALQILGEGFTSHPKNAALRDALRAGGISLADFHGQLLRVVYRLIFLFVAEDRTLDGQPLLHPRDNSEHAHIARKNYAAHYSSTRLRELAGTIKGSRHGDLWRQFHVVVSALSGNDASAVLRQKLALPALGSYLWNPMSTAAITDAELTNYDFLEALRNLAFTRQGTVLRPVDYRNLGAEELGGVYESLLALTPQISADGARFTFAEFAGNERKTSGSYYTPDSLVQGLLDSALDPVVDKAITGKTGAEAEKGILALKICDPAVGSGHFLVGAAHRIARHLSRVRALTQGEGEPSPLLYQHALRDVIGRCLYGVDVNPMAAELCRVSLWLEAMEPGKPLSFLDHHIRVGNSLLGATPELIAGGVPDEAFNAIEGDDKRACAELRRRNKVERKGFGPLFAEQEAELQALLQQSAAALEDLPDDQPEDIRAKELAFRRHEETREYRRKKELADAWCAAFVTRKYFLEPGRESSATGVTQGLLNDLVAGRMPQTALVNDIERVVKEYQFFHWHLAFPEVFTRGGFDVMLGNPPWEHVEIKEQEWFASKNPAIAQAPNAAARKRMIETLRGTDPPLHSDFMAALRKVDAENHLCRNSGRFPLCARGRINTYALFAEHNRTALRQNGRAGFIVPSGIATDDTTKEYFQALVESEQLVSIYHFENEDRVFPGVHHAARFVLLTIGAGAAAADLVFYARQPAELLDPERHFRLTAADFVELNPNTRTCPTFRSRQDADLNLAIYRRTGVLWRDGDGNPWSLRLMQGIFNMASDSALFRTKAQMDATGSTLCGNRYFGAEGEFVPLVEGKMIHHFDHRFGTYEGQTQAQASQGKLPELDDAAHADPTRVVLPEYWVARVQTDERLEGIWTRAWMLGWRDITGTEKQRTVIASIVPRTAVGHTIPLMFSATAPASVAALYGNLCSFILDYTARQKVGGTHLTYSYLKQLPILTPDTYERDTPWARGVSLREWLLPRVLELVFNAWELERFANDVGHAGPPYRWDSTRRFLLRGELDAAFFHIYGLSRDDVAHVMDTFPIVRKNDENTIGEYRTKRLILEIYDSMQEAATTGREYETRLEPPPADPRRRHPKRSIGILAFGSLINDPGPELQPKIVMRLKTITPFPVEYGRYSGTTRGGAPTLVPHQAGGPVEAEILVLDDSANSADVEDMLWRRETRKIDSRERYVEGASANSVLIKHFKDSPCVCDVLYTDFHAAGKVERLSVDQLAAKAIQSVKSARDGMDGISYLIGNLAAGIETPLTPAYKAEILRQTNTESLEEALASLKSGAK